MPSPPLLSTVKEGMVGVWHKMSREFEFLEKNGANAELIRVLRELAKQDDIASYHALAALDEITEGLDHEQTDLLRRKVILDDLAWMVEDGYYDNDQPMPFNFTPERLAAALAKIDGSIEIDAWVADAGVADAIRKRGEAWATIKGDYVDSMEAVGFKVGEKLRNPNYYRHQVIDHAMLKADLEDKRAWEKVVEGIKKAPSSMKLPTQRGFLKGRQGKEHTYNTHYLEAEYEVMAQMIFDKKIAEVILLVKDQYNIMDDLKSKAKRHNDAVVMQIFERMAEAMNVQMPLGAGMDEVRQLTGADLYRRTLNVQMAIGFDKLGKLAMSGVLDTGSDGEWTHVVASLAEQAQMREATSGISDEEVDPMAFATTDTVDTPDIIAYAAWLLNDRKGSAGSGAAAMIFKGMAYKKSKMKEMLGTINQFKTWRDFQPEGYVEFYPRESSMFAMAHTVKEGVAEKLLEDELEKAEVTIADLTRVLTVWKREPYIVPVEVAATLESMAPKEPSFWLRPFMWITRKWMGPRRFVKYSIRNQTGDVDAVIAGDHTLLTTKRGRSMISRAARELATSLFRGRRLSGDQLDWFERGGSGTTMRAQELKEVGTLRVFRERFSRGTNDQDGLALLLEYVKKPFSGYMDVVGAVGDWREGMLRYAAYLHYLESMRGNSGVPHNFGASRPDEIMGLADYKDRAFKLSNELLGAYDSIGEFGKAMRRGPIPF